MRCVISCGSTSIISMAFILLWNSAVRVYDSQAYRQMDVHVRPSVKALSRLLLELSPGIFASVNGFTVSEHLAVEQKRNEFRL